MVTDCEMEMRDTYGLDKVFDACEDREVFTSLFGAAHGG